MEKDLKFNWQAIGHKQQKLFLEKSILKETLSQAYLITGQEKLGKKTIARDFAKLLQCESKNKSKYLPCGKCRSCLMLEKNSHPDVLIIKPEELELKGIKKERAIGIEEIRKLQHQVGLYSYCSPYKIGLIFEAEKMTQEAANSLLKTLEEPPAKTVIILTAVSENFILPTIVSRCQILKLLSVPRKEVEKALTDDGAREKEAQKLARISAGRPELAFELYKNPEKIQQISKITEELAELIQSDYNKRYKYIEDVSRNVLKAREMLKIWLFWFRDLILENLNCQEIKIEISPSKNLHKKYSLQKISEIIHSIKETERLISTTNINPRLALEVLVLNL